MNSSRKDLSHYFDAFRATHQMSEQQAWDLLERATAPHDPASQPAATEITGWRKGGMFYSIVGITAIVSTLLLIDTPWSERPVESPAAGRIAAAGRSTTSADGSSAPADRSSATADRSTAQSDRSSAATTTPFAPQRYSARPDRAAGMDRPRAMTPDPLRMEGDTLTLDSIRRNPASKAQNPPPSKEDTSKPDTIGKNPAAEAPPTQSNRGAIEMTGTPVVELTPLELRDFGIVADGDGWGMFTRNSSDRIFHLWYGPRQSSRMYADTMPPATWNAPMLSAQAILVTKPDGVMRSMQINNDRFAPEEYRQMRSASRDSEEYQKVFPAYREKLRAYVGQVTPSLIPIALHTGSPDSSETTLLWFVADEETIARLPERVRSRIAAELKAAEDYEQGRMTQQQLISAAPTPMFELLRSSDGSVTRSVLSSRLPVYDRKVAARSLKCTLNLTLAEPRSLRIELFDIQGRRIDQLVGASEFAAGNQTVEFDVALNPSGMYLVVVTSDREERVVHRLWVMGWQ